jgi:glucose/arabinose dehydrogenase
MSLEIHRHPSLRTPAAAAVTALLAFAGCTALLAFAGCTKPPAPTAGTTAPPPQEPETAPGEKVQPTATAPTVAPPANAPTAAPVPVKKPPPKIKIIVRSKPEKCLVFWGKKKLGETPVTLERPRDSGPVDFVVKLDGYFPLHTRAYTFHNDVIYAKLTKLEDRMTLFGAKHDATTQQPAAPPGSAATGDAPMPAPTTNAPAPAP